MTDLDHHLLPNEKLLVIIGPSGVGKSTIVERLVKDGHLELTPSWTTRQARNGIEHVTDHVFASETEFDNLKQQGFFLETAQLFGLPYYYGLPKVTHNRPAAVPSVVLRTMVLPLLHKHYTNVVVYQIEASKDRVKSRLHGRGGTAEDIQKRLSLYEEEMAEGRKIANRIFINNGSLDDIHRELLDALKADF